VHGTPRNGAPEFAALPDRHCEPPAARYREPVLIVQGTADTTVPAGISKETAAALARAGTRVTYTSYEGVDHPSLRVTALMRSTPGSTRGRRADGGGAHAPVPRGGPLTAAVLMLRYRGAGR
jgi:acetyl esterase/lipase